MIATVLLALVPAARAQDAGTGIAWSADLSTAFAEAKEQQKILMICVNATHVDGSPREEPAAKGLREVVYRDPRFVKRSRDFVCALLTRSSASAEFGELRLLGIEGPLVSPQHIFVRPDGTEILVREEYWRHGKGEPAVLALLALMDDAQAKLSGDDGAPAAEGSPAGVPSAPTGDERPAWIRERLDEAGGSDRSVRIAAVEALVRNDAGGDCLTPLLGLLDEHKKNAQVLVDIIRGLGRDQLLDAAQPVAEFLGHREDALRGMAAVSLEYIGSRDKEVVAALTRAAGRERDEAIANHMYRALGRCGVEESRVRSLLLKECEGARSEFASFGPAIGLAYFEGDAKAARGVEKILKKIGVPGGRRGGGENGIKRGVLCWTLASIGDRDSGAFMREELLSRLENMKAFWVEGLKGFYETVARKCEGDASAMPAVEEGVRVIVSFARGWGRGEPATEQVGLMDEYRKDRTAGNFTPRGDGLLGGSG
jgi:hypothetical protein